MSGSEAQRRGAIVRADPRVYQGTRDAGDRRMQSLTRAHRRLDRRLITVRSRHDHGRSNPGHKPP